MALVPCPACVHRVSAKALACPSCGHPGGGSDFHGLAGIAGKVAGIYVSATRLTDRVLGSVMLLSPAAVPILSQD